MLLNQILSQRYRVVEQVGQGGFAVVYKAVDMQRNDYPVALKKINLADLTARQKIEVTDAFNREVLFLTDLQHPHLPRFFNSFTDPEHWYIVMDFIEGLTLEEYVQTKRNSVLSPRNDALPAGCLPLHEVVEIGLQVCSVLAYLHNRQPPIVFRDLKPSNIMRTSTGHLYLIDFGIARHYKAGQSRDTIPLGSPGYAPPEQYGKAQTTPQADIYSLGVLLHQLLTGDDPSETPFKFSPLASSLTAFDMLLKPMLQLDPAKRLHNVAQVKHELTLLSRSYLSLTGEKSLWSTLPTDTSRSIAPSSSSSSQQGSFSQQQQLYQPSGLLTGSNRLVGRRTALAAGVAFAGVVTVLGMVGTAIFFSKTGSLAPSGPYPPLAVHPTAQTLYIYRGHSDLVNSAMWSPDGRRIASTSNDKTVQVWDAADGSHVVTYKRHTDAVRTLAWSPDGKRIVSSSWDKTTQVWDAATGSPLYSYHGHSDVVLALSWSPDGKYIVSGGNDGTAQIFEARNGAYLFTCSGHDPQSFMGVTALAWSPNGKQIAGGSNDGLVRIWDATDGSILLIYNGHLHDQNAPSPVTSVAWSPDGMHIASGGTDSTVQVWSAVDGQLLYTYHGHAATPNEDVFVTWSPDGKRIASCSWDRIIHVWNAADGGHVYLYNGHSDLARTVAWSPSGNRIVSGAFDQTVQVWIDPFFARS